MTVYNVSRVAVLGQLGVTTLAVASLDGVALLQANLPAGHRIFSCCLASHGQSVAEMAQAMQTVEFWLGLVRLKEEPFGADPPTVAAARTAVSAANAANSVNAAAVAAVASHVATASITDAVAPLSSRQADVEGFEESMRKDKKNALSAIWGWKNALPTTAVEGGEEGGSRGIDTTSGVEIVGGEDVHNNASLHQLQPMPPSSPAIRRRFGTESEQPGRGWRESQKVPTLPTTGDN
ncbi:hypothetical protein B0H63DRAFT_538141 [Podospora didyma]|uniref:Uncharacterized protein n=1 Tax=Podospora didyma TaxID=330526 RepID=A0AAE0NYC6_9PEZI|nr:hypothetical protein B0H63DRAFT_538141 [Podospora didyma]